MGKSTVIAVGSITNAIRARQELTKNGIDCTIQRVSVHIPNRGCGYCVRTDGENGSSAEEILKKIGIRILEVAEESQ